MTQSGGAGGGWGLLREIQRALPSEEAWSVEILGLLPLILRRLPLILGRSTFPWLSSGEYARVLRAQRCRALGPGRSGGVRGPGSWRARPVDPPRLENFLYNYFFSPESEGCLAH